LLRGFGYDIISIGNADRNDYEATEIIDRSGHEDVARAFAEVIRCENIHFESLRPGTPAEPQRSGGEGVLEASLRDSPPGNIELGIEMNFQNLEYRSDFTLIIGKDFNGRYVTGG
jgi:hypothetical protein